MNLLRKYLYIYTFLIGNVISASDTHEFIQHILVETFPLVTDAGEFAVIPDAHKDNAYYFKHLASNFIEGFGCNSDIYSNCYKKTASQLPTEFYFRLYIYSKFAFPNKIICFDFPLLNFDSTDWNVLSNFLTHKLIDFNIYDHDLHLSILDRVYSTFYGKSLKPATEDLLKPYIKKFEQLAAPKSISQIRLKSIRDILESDDPGNQQERNFVVTFLRSEKKEFDAMFEGPQSHKKLESSGYTKIHYQNQDSEDTWVWVPIHFIETTEVNLDLHHSIEYRDNHIILILSGRTDYIFVDSFPSNLESSKVEDILHQIYTFCENHNIDVRYRNDLMERVLKATLWKKPGSSKKES